ncbi:uncharacterized protein ctdsp1 isoform X1 [Osmerus mordax]|uniref:uncharacterized protein ctdsp1 isoform X1 n=1 Tax=Osmerus mordax TaxID=8014 RepID=UPI00350FC1A1
MSTCTLLLRSQAGCGLSDSPRQPAEHPLSPDLTDVCRFSGENRSLTECLEQFKTSEHYKAIGGRQLFVYLEPSDPSKLSGREEVCEGMPAERCTVSALREVMDSTKPFDQIDEPCKMLDTTKAVVNYSEHQMVYEEIDPAVEQCNVNGELEEEIEHSVPFNGDSEGLEDCLLPHQHPEACETEMVNKSCHECIQHLEGFDLGESSEHSANQSRASECCRLCEHCTEHLQSSQLCKSYDQQNESVEPDKRSQTTTEYFEQDFEPDLSQCKCSDQSKSFDSNRLSQTETEFLEQDFEPDLAESVNLFECYARNSEYSETTYQIDETSECTLVLDEYLSNFDSIDEQIDICELSEASAEQSFTVSDDLNTPMSSQGTEENVNPCESDCQSEASEYTNNIDPAEDISYDVIDHATPSLHCELSCQTSQDEQQETSEDCGCFEQREPYENLEGENEHTFYDHNAACCIEEDESSSQCSSTETKSFATCNDGSIPSAACSDSGESDKGAQDEDSYEQNEWESFEEDDLQESDESTDDKDEDCSSAVVTEDFFDLFDRVDFHGHSFVQRRPYISCFEGGDVHDFYVAQLKLEKTTTCANDSKESEEDDTHATPVQDLKPSDEEQHGEDEALNILHPYVGRPDTGSFADEGSVKCDTQENTDKAIGAFVTRNELQESEGLEKYLSEASEKDHVSCPAMGECLVDVEACEDEGADALCVDDELSCADDSYQPSEEQGSGSDADNGQTDDPVLTKDMDAQPVECYIQEIILDLIRQITQDGVHEEESCDDEDGFSICTEREPYWSCTENGEIYEPGIEEYYMYEINTCKPCIKHEACEPCGRKRNPPTQHQEAAGRVEERDSRNTILHEEENELSHFKIIEVVDLNGEFNDHTESFTPSIKEVKINNENQQKTQYPETNDWSETDVSEKTALGEAEHRAVSVGSRPSEQSEQEGGEETHEFFKMVDENKACEQNEDPEEEESEEESAEGCDCEYCTPPPQQLPAKPLLPQVKSKDAGKICVVIDLDETLVHSSFKPVNNADFIIPVEIDGTVHQVYVLKRPHVDEFLKRMGELFECVLFTASLSKYADPVSDLLDKWGAFRSRLFRESCVFHRGNYVKDLSRLGRDLNKVIILDNSPASYIFHPDNAVPVASWFDDMADTELLDLIPFFERLSKVDNIYDVLKQQRTTS